jgi:hypothetical protein
MIEVVFHLQKKMRSSSNYIKLRSSSIFSLPAMRTIIVRCGHLGLDGLLVTQLQQGVVHGRLAVPLATLDNELYHVNNDASDGFQVFI